MEREFQVRVYLHEDTMQKHKLFALIATVSIGTVYTLFYTRVLLSFHRMPIFIKCCEKSNSADILTKLKNISKTIPILINAKAPVFIFLHLTLRISSCTSYFSNNSRNSDLCVKAIDLVFCFPETCLQRSVRSQALEGRVLLPGTQSVMQMNIRK